MPTQRASLCWSLFTTRQRRQRRGRSRLSGRRRPDTRVVRATTAVRRLVVAATHRDPYGLPETSSRPSRNDLLLPYMHPSMYRTPSQAFPPDRPPPEHPWRSEDDHHSTRTPRQHRDEHPLDRHRPHPAVRPAQTQLTTSRFGSWFRVLSPAPQRTACRPASSKACCPRAQAILGQCSSRPRAPVLLSRRERGLDSGSYAGLYQESMRQHHRALPR